MDNMARHKANDKSDPNNFPEDTGLRYCNECGNDIAVDLTNAEEAEVGEFTNCYSHLKDIESLREECSRRDRSIHGLVDEVAFLKRGWATKDARIYELELGIDALDKGLKRLEELSKPEPITEAGGGK